MNNKSEAITTKRILHVIARFNTGGTARYLDSISKISVEIIGFHLATGHVRNPEVESPLLQNLPHSYIKNLGRRINIVDDVKSYFQLKRVIKEYKPDLIQSHTFKAGLLVRLMRLKIPVIHTLHGHLFYDPEFGYLAKKAIFSIEKYLAKRCALILTTGENVASDIVAKGIAAPAHVQSLQLGITPPDFHVKGDALRSLGLVDDGRVKIGWVGRVTGVKNPKRVLEIARALPDIDFIIAGGGDLYQEISQSNLKNCKILGWQNPAIVWSSVDIALSTSHNEGVPFSLIEAAFLSKPLIGAKVGAIDEIIHEGKNGFLVNDTCQDYVDAINRLLQDKSLLTDFGNYSSELAKQKFDLEDKQLQLTQIYSKYL